MKLIELDASFLRYTPRPPTEDERSLNPKWPMDHVVDCFQMEGIDINQAHGLIFICPKSRAANKDHYIQVYFVGSPIPSRLGKNKDGKTVRWERQGTGIDDLSLQPSIQEEDDYCRWHGHITLGDAK